MASIITIKRNGNIVCGDVLLGTYKYHKLGGYNASGCKLIPHYYSVELINGERFKIVYTQKDIREIATKRWEVLMIWSKIKRKQNKSN